MFPPLPHTVVAVELLAFAAAANHVYQRTNMHSKLYNLTSQCFVMLCLSLIGRRVTGGFVDTCGTILAASKMAILSPFVIIMLKCNPDLFLKWYYFGHVYLYEQ